MGETEKRPFLLKQQFQWDASTAVIRVKGTQIALRPTNVEMERVKCVGISRPPANIPLKIGDTITVAYILRLFDIPLDRFVYLTVKELLFHVQNPSPRVSFQVKRRNSWLALLDKLARDSALTSRVTKKQQVAFQELKTAVSEAQQNEEHFRSPTRSSSPSQGRATRSVSDEAPSSHSEGEKMALWGRLSQTDAGGSTASTAVGDNAGGNGSFRSGAREVERTPATSARERRALLRGASSAGLQTESQPLEFRSLRNRRSRAEAKRRQSLLSDDETKQPGLPLRSDDVANRTLASTVARDRTADGDSTRASVNDSRSGSVQVAAARDRGREGARASEQKEKSGRADSVESKSSTDKKQNVVGLTAQQNDQREPPTTAEGGDDKLPAGEASGGATAVAESIRELTETIRRMADGNDQKVAGALSLVQPILQEKLKAVLNTDTLPQIERDTTLVDDKAQDKQSQSARADEGSSEAERSGTEGVQIHADSAQKQMTSSPPVLVGGRLGKFKKLAKVDDDSTADRRKDEATEPLSPSLELKSENDVAFEGAQAVNSSASAVEPPTESVDIDTSRKLTKKKSRRSVKEQAVEKPNPAAASSVPAVESPAGPPAKPPSYGHLDASVRMTNEATGPTTTADESMSIDTVDEAPGKPTTSVETVLGISLDTKGADSKRRKRNSPDVVVENEPERTDRQPSPVGRKKKQDRTATSDRASGKRSSRGRKRKASPVRRSTQEGITDDVAEPPSLQQSTSRPSETKKNSGKKEAKKQRTIDNRDIDSGSEKSQSKQEKEDRGLKENIQSEPIQSADDDSKGLATLTGKRQSAKRKGKPPVRLADAQKKVASSATDRKAASKGSSVKQRFAEESRNGAKGRRDNSLERESYLEFSRGSMPTTTAGILSLLQDRRLTERQQLQLTMELSRLQAEEEEKKRKEREAQRVISAIDSSANDEEEEELFESEESYWEESSDEGSPKLTDGGRERPATRDGQAPWSPYTPRQLQSSEYRCSRCAPLDRLSKEEKLKAGERHRYFQSQHSSKPHSWRDEIESFLHNKDLYENKVLCVSVPEDAFGSVERSDRLAQRRLIQQTSSLLVSSSTEEGTGSGAEEAGSKSAASDALRFNALVRRRKKLRFEKSRIHGWGLFAAEPIEAGEMVIEYIGEIITQKRADEREKIYDRKGFGATYMFHLDNNTVIDATRKGNYARYINHCCEPNCFSKIIVVDGRKKVVLYAKRPIEPGEELNYDYMFTVEDDDQKIPCLCGAKKCRGYMN